MNTYLKNMNMLAQQNNFMTPFKMVIARVINLSYKFRKKIVSFQLAVFIILYVKCYLLIRF